MTTPNPNHLPASNETDPARAVVDEWLDGVQATRDGLFDVFFIEGPNGGLIFVDRGNAHIIEEQIREGFSEQYPDLLVHEPREET